MTRILAIESSCDETAAAVIENGTHILSNVIASQTELHAQYGGVFPEVASRKHVELIYPVIQQAMNEARLTFGELDAVAVTYGPGLVGSLLVGVNAAKGIALACGLPLLPIHHIEGHIYSLWLTEHASQIEFPVLNLVVSGGHTELYLMNDHHSYLHLGGTLDDAVGEAYDKVGRLLNLPYPGGPHVDRAARRGNPNAFRFPRATLGHDYNFSFSGLKTAVLREIQKQKEKLPVDDLAASFQKAAVDVLVSKTVMAAKELGVKAVHISGGVSANSGLREDMIKALTIAVRYPPLTLCTDNAAMIGSAAHFRWLHGLQSSYNFDVIPHLPLV